MIKKYVTTKNLMIAGILALFIVAVIINVTGNKNERVSKNDNAQDQNEATEVLANADYYTAFRSNRDSVREKEVAYLESIITSEKTDEETVSEANEKKLEIVNCMESELLIESSIKAKGFKDAAVTFHKGSVNVVVDSQELSAQQVAQILDIVMRQTGEPAENIKVSVQR